jgi:branched-chain amino acid transport system permease protein
MAIGSFSAAALSTQFHQSFVVTLLVSTVFGAVIGVIVSIPSMRIRGLYMLVATLALTYIVSYLTQRYQLSRSFGGGITMPTPAVAGHQLFSPGSWYYTWAVFAALAVIWLALVRRGSIGRSWMSMRASPDLSAAFGVRYFRASCLAFAVTSAIIALQGAFYGYFIGVVSSGSFTLDISISYLAMIVVGGEGTALGSVLGATTITVIPFVLQPLANWITAQTGIGNTLVNDLFAIQTIIFGLLIIVSVVYLPRGLAYPVEVVAHWLQRVGLDAVRARRAAAPVSGAEPIEDSNATA